MLPFVPILEIWRSYFGIVERDSPEEARRKIAGTLLLLGEEFRGVLPIVFEFLGVGDPEQPAPLVDGDARQRALFGFLRRLTQARAEREPSVVLIDDLHWIDPASDAFVGQFVEAVEGQRVLFVANFRPEYHGAWLRKSYYHQLPLLPLGPEATEVLLDDLLGRDGALGPLRSKILERTRGNPFFVEEVVQTLLESRALEGVRGALRLAHSVESLEIPSTVQAVLASRIDRLAEREKRLLSIASVAGMVVPAEILRRTAGLSDAELSVSLAKLSETELLYEAAIYPRAEYAFKHPLTQEVAYRSQLGEQRRRVHAEVARALEDLEAARLDETAAELAHHYEEAGEAFDAARWHARAAEWVGRENPAEALRHWTRVRELLQRTDEGEAARGLRLDAALRILPLGWSLGMSEADAAAIFEEGRALAEQAGNLVAQALILGNYGVIRALDGSPAEFVHCASEGLRIARMTTDRALQLAIRMFVAYAHWWAGNLAMSLAHAEDVIEDAQGDDSLGSQLLLLSPLLGCLQIRGDCLGQMGQIANGLEQLRQVADLARRAQDLNVLSWSESSQVYVKDVAGDRVGAMEHAIRGLEAAEKTGTNFARSFAHAAVGLAFTLNERWHEAISVLERGLAIAVETREHSWQPLSYSRRWPRRISGWGIPSVL
jgi:adenylate cyclase